MRGERRDVPGNRLQERMKLSGQSPEVNSISEGLNALSTHKQRDNKDFLLRVYQGLPPSCHRFPVLQIPVTSGDHILFYNIVAHVE